MPCDSYTIITMQYKLKTFHLHIYFCIILNLFTHKEMPRNYYNSDASSVSVNMNLNMNNTSNSLNNINNSRHIREMEAIVGILKLKKGNKHSMHRVSEKIKKSPLQLKVLKELYTITQFPSTQTRNDLSLLIDIPQRSIQVWFQNTRQANRRITFDQPRNSYEIEPDEIPVCVLMDIIAKIKNEMNAN